MMPFLHSLIKRSLAKQFAILDQERIGIFQTWVSTRLVDTVFGVFGLLSVGRMANSLCRLHYLKSAYYVKIFKCLQSKLQLAYALLSPPLPSPRINSSSSSSEYMLLSKAGRTAEHSHTHTETHRDTQSCRPWIL